MPPPSSRSRQGFNAPRSSSRRAPPRDNSRDDNRSGMQSINHHPNDDLPPINQVEQPASRYNSRQQQDQFRTLNSLAAKTEEDCVFHAIFQCLCNGELRPLTDDPKKMMTTLMVRIIQALVSCVLADLSVPQPVDRDDNETPFDAMMSSICSNFKEFVEFASYISVTLPKRGPLSAAYINYITNELGLPKPRNAMVDMPLFHVEIANIKKSINAICAISDPASTAAESGMQTKQRSFADISSEILKLILICPQFVDLSLEKPDDDVALVVKYTRRIRELSEQTGTLLHCHMRAFLTFGCLLQLTPPPCLRRLRSKTPLSTSIWASLRRQQCRWRQHLRHRPRLSRIPPTTRKRCKLTSRRLRRLECLPRFLRLRLPR